MLSELNSMLHEQYNDTCTLFGATLKIHKKSNFDWNQVKLSMQHKNMYMYQKKI